MAIWCGSSQHPAGAIQNDNSGITLRPARAGERQGRAIHPVISSIKLPQQIRDFTLIEVCPAMKAAEAHRCAQAVGVPCQAVSPDADDQYVAAEQAARREIDRQLEACGWMVPPVSSGR